MKTDITSLLRLNDITGRLILVIYGAGTTLVAFLNLTALIRPSAGLISLALLWVALIVLALPGAEPFELRRTVAVIVLIGIITALSSANIRNVQDPGYAGWYMGAVTFLTLVLALRGRRWLAWLGFSIFGAITFASTMWSGYGLVASINDVARQAATLLIGTLFAVVLRRASRTITSIQEKQLARATTEAATAAATRERATQNARLERDARPALERILSGEPLSSEELQEFALLEATLRDGIRAAGFGTDGITSEARAARERGIQVVLLDDRDGELPPADRERLEGALITELRSTQQGTVTARLSPQDHDEVATIVVEENGQYRSITVGPESVSITHL